MTTVARVERGETRGSRGHCRNHPGFASRNTGLRAAPSTRAGAAGRIAIAIATAAAIAGCTTQQAYSSMQAWQRNECNRQVEQTAREQCLARTSMSYDEYRRRTDDGTKP